MRNVEVLTRIADERKLSDRIKAFWLARILHSRIIEGKLERKIRKRKKTGMLEYNKIISYRQIKECAQNRGNGERLAVTYHKIVLLKNTNISSVVL